MFSSKDRESEPKVAIVCDWLTNMAGAERVVLELHRMYPKAPIYTSTYEKQAMPLLICNACPATVRVALLWHPVAAIFTARATVANG